MASTLAASRTPAAFDERLYHRGTLVSTVRTPLVPASPPRLTPMSTLPSARRTGPRRAPLSDDAAFSSRSHRPGSIVFGPPGSTPVGHAENISKERDQRQSALLRTKSTMPEYQSVPATLAVPSASLLVPTPPEGRSRQASFPSHENEGDQKFGAPSSGVGGGRQRRSVLLPTRAALPGIRSPDGTGASEIPTVSTNAATAQFLTLLPALQSARF